MVLVLSLKLWLLIVVYKITINDCSFNLKANNASFNYEFKI